ncbi:MAG: EamA family transporter, partial [Alphaproteobacteria bacterium]
MTLTTISIVLFAALLHALWNAFVKAADDRLAILGLISVGHVILGIVLASQSPIPAPESWPFIAGSTVIHFGYYFLLYHSYRLGDLSHVYPIARGMSPVLVALGAQVFAGEALPPAAWAGILLASTGIFMMAGDVFRGETPPLVVLTALATGVMIAAYSLVDGMGVRLAQTSLGYVGWLFIAETFTAIFILARVGRGMLTLSRKTLVLGLIGGLVSATAYGLVIYVK